MAFKRDTAGDFNMWVILKEFRYRYIHANLYKLTKGCILVDSVFPYNYLTMNHILTVSSVHKPQGIFFNAGVFALFVFSMELCNNLS